VLFYVSYQAERETLTEKKGMVFSGNKDSPESGHQLTGDEGSGVGNLWQQRCHLWTVLATHIFSGLIQPILEK
jgi:hypothetical protein